MTDIPADIMRAAREHVTTTIADDAGNTLEYFVAPYTNKAVRVIASAIMAEREACAKTAEGFTITAHIAHDMKSGIFPECSSANVAVASAIRSERAGE